MLLRHPVIPFTLAIGLILPGCFLLGGGGDDGPAPLEPTERALVASDGERLVLVGPEGVIDGTSPFPVLLTTTTNLAASLDRSRAVVAGIDAESGEHGVYILQRSTFERVGGEVERSVVGQEARWIWLVGPADGGTAALFHNDAIGDAAASAPVGELELLGFGPDDAFAILKAGATVRVVHPGDREVSFEPGMGEGVALLSVRHDAVLLAPSVDDAGTWFGLDGVEGGAEDTVPRLGHTLRDGSLSWLSDTELKSVAIDLPDDIDVVVASDIGVVLTRRGSSLTYFDYLGMELGTFEPEALAEEEGGPLPDLSEITRVVPMGVGAREGVLVVTHSFEPDEGGAEADRYRTVYEYHLDDSNTLSVQRISTRAASAAPGHFGFLAGSAYVAWVEPGGVVAYYDITTRETARADVPGEVFFEAHHSSAFRHY